MVGERLTDGVRIGQLLASEIAGNEGRLRNLAVADADPDVEPTPTARSRTGWFAAAREAGRTAMKSRRRVRKARDLLVAEAYVQPDRLRIEFVTGRGEVMGPASPQSPPTPPRAPDSVSDRRRSGRRGRWCSSRTARR